MSSRARSTGHATTPAASARHPLCTRTAPSRDHRQGFGEPQDAAVGVEGDGVGLVRATGSNSSPVRLDDSFGSLGRSPELEFVGTRGGGAAAAVVGGSSGVEEADEIDEDYEQGGG